jgi:hypothetical protein
VVQLVVRVSNLKTKSKAKNEPQVKTQALVDFCTTRNFEIRTTARNTIQQFIKMLTGTNCV